MRKIVTREEKERAEKKKVRILSFFLLLLMIGSVAGYAFVMDYRNDNPPSSNGNSGSTADGRWTAQVGGQNLIFSNSPASVSEVDVKMYNTLASYTSQPLYISSENKAVTYEISSTLGLYASRVQESCYGNCTKDLPEKNCTENLIVWKDSGENKVYQEDSCIFIEGDIRAADAFLYKILGIN